MSNEEDKESKIIGLHQFDIKKETVRSIYDDYGNFSNFTLKRVMSGIRSRLTSAGWYFPEYSNSDLNDFHYDKSGKIIPKVIMGRDYLYNNEYTSFKITSSYRHLIRTITLLEDQWKYFIHRQSFSIGDIVMKNGNYHEITGFRFDPDPIRSKKGIVLEMRSLVTGTPCEMRFSKIHKMKKYELSDNQKTKIQRKAREMEERVQRALKKTTIGMEPRKRLGFQSNFVKKMK